MHRVRPTPSDVRGNLDLGHIMMLVIPPLVRDKMLFKQLPETRQTITPAPHVLDNEVVEQVSSI